MTNLHRILGIFLFSAVAAPAAEIVFRKMVEDEGREDEFEIDSAGTIGFHKGNPPDLRMTDHLAKRGYAVEGKSRQLVAGDLSEFDLLLTMDEENLADTLGLDSSGELHHKVKSFVDFLRENEAHRIPDPYYGGPDGFDLMFEMIDRTCAAFVEHLVFDLSS